MSVGVMQDVSAREGARLGREESESLCADAFTKPLDSETLNRHFREMGFIDLGDSEDDDIEVVTGVAAEVYSREEWIAIAWNENENETEEE